MKIGQKIRILRKRLGISPEKLGMLADLSGQYIRKVEAGQYDNITLETAKKFAKALNVSISALLDTDELQEQAIKDLDLANFFYHELPKLKEEDKNLLRHSINVIREKAKQEYNAESDK
jgi:transcriptional regulator with XRE-family HTH domain